LERALTEPGDYALRLRTGEVVRFTRAERHGAFVVLFAPGGLPALSRSDEALPEFPHGLEVRISEIVWCARGPGQTAPSEPTAVGSVADLSAGVYQAPGVRVPLRIKHDEQ
jgi:hypothetical protein